ncbi:uncharacterized protein TM35_000032820 [Trypanosoma theileri]|uniref:Uncharacterized protein n=1 Tax=Trypanosoma theileri TaxID=67003 RepID=A0A1X0P7I4_9TRYP|nr:uncharacterized protein TM35_000032820 [Trypanosoma theileri]ORC92529.1 hypothetical protein TM35_000032820 [Trypanosoma theileri]
MSGLFPAEQTAQEGNVTPQPSAKMVKTVSFHPSANCQVPRSSYSKNYSNFSESLWDSQESNSGYFHEKDADVDEGIQQGYYKRLYRFYEQYNPQKLDRVEEYLAAYKGKEEQLFAILTGKYGPEPENREVYPTNSINASENASVMHYVGKRYNFPTVVTPQQGNTDCETPYWGNTTLISEQDILYLLSHLETNNEELQKCYMGLFAQHPINSWNGMTYVTRAEGVAPSDTPFLGHIWAGSLASKKAMVYEGTLYNRVVLYCTDECQRRGDHERWRLNIYSSDVNSLRLLRVVWDPVVSLEPLPVSRSSFSVHTSLEGASLMGSSASCPGLRSNSIAEPKQPVIAVTMANIVASLERLEKNICGRLDALDARISSLESRLGDTNSNVSSNSKT